MVKVRMAILPSFPQRGSRVAACRFFKKTLQKYSLMGEVGRKTETNQFFAYMKCQFYNFFYLNLREI